MDKMPNLVLGILLVATLALGSFLGNDLQNIREAEAFYRWIFAAATQDRLFDSSMASESYDDAELFSTFSTTAADALQQVDWDLVESTAGPNAFQEYGTTPLADLEPRQQVAALVSVNAVEMDQMLWDVVRSSEQRENRMAFLEGARNSRLEFAKGIKYADAQAGGVNIFNLFLGFRQVAATLLWIKVDSFWHQGMVHRMSPLMTTCVTLDPHFVDAYLLGAWHLAFNVTAKMQATPAPMLEWEEQWQACVGDKERYYYEAADFLKDGIRNNPRNYKLYFDLGYGIFNLKLKDYPNSIRYLEEAVRQPHERWVPRMLYNAYEANGEYDKAIDGWEGYMARFPENSASVTDTAPRSIRRNRALYYTQQMNENFDAASAATAEQEKAALLAEAEEFKAKAMQVWQDMGTDPIALANLMKIEAQGYARAGDYVLAIAKLDLARYEYMADAFWFPTSELMIEYKELGGIPLTITERKAKLRSDGGDDCRNKPTLQEAA